MLHPIRRLVMNRRHFLRSGFALGGLAAAATPLKPFAATRGHQTGDIHSRWVPSLTIRDHLTSEARQITDAAVTGLPSAAQWRRDLPARRRQWVEMLGLDASYVARHEPPPTTVTGVLERGSYRIEKLYYESWPGLYVTANLYVPRTATSEPAPGVLYVCGHSANQKTAFQAHARRFAELGFVCLIVETVQLGEIAGFHHGCYREGWWHWYSRGYTPAGIETLNGIRGLDLLAARPEVDPDRLGVTGISGGGASSWWIAAADDRVKAAAPVCGTASLYSQIHDRTIDGHCDCMWWINSRRWDLADVGALVAPRALLIGSANKDGIFTIESIRRVHQQILRVYRKLGAADHLRLVETPGGHSYHERSRTEIFSWFARHLQHRDIPASAIGDIDARPEKQESVESLRVYHDGPPAAARTAEIHDLFVPSPSLPELPDAASLARERIRVVAALQEHTFGAFPARPPGLDVQREYEFDEDATGCRFAFTSEPGWRLHGFLLHRKPRTTQTSTRSPAIVAPCLPAEPRWDTRAYVLRLREPWARIAFEPRGTGDTSWGEDLNWHVRRAAAWTGRTIASMRVWDTLRALQAARELPDVDPNHICLAGRGEMAAVVLYAALLDGQVRTVFLENPPPTQNAPSERNGRGTALEMLNCLRFTDLPQVAALLWPTELVFVGPTPSTYEWTEAIHQRLGAPGRVSRVASLSDWKRA